MASSQRSRQERQPFISTTVSRLLSLLSGLPSLCPKHNSVSQGRRVAMHLVTHSLVPGGGCPDQTVYLIVLGLDGSVWLPPPTANTSNDRSRLQMSTSAGTLWRLQSYQDISLLTKYNLFSYLTRMRVTTLVLLSDRNQTNWKQVRSNCGTSDKSS